jgi:hypothetical protein
MQMARPFLHGPRGLIESIAGRQVGIAGLGNRLHDQRQRQCNGCGSALDGDFPFIEFARLE